MKTISALALAAALAAGGYTAASAQDAGVDAGVDAGAGVSDDVSVDAGLDAGAEAGAGADAGAADGAAAPEVEADATAVAQQYTYEDVRAALEATADLDLSVLTDETPIEIVPLSQLAGGDDDATAFVAGEADLAGPVSETQTAITGNAQIETALQEEGYTLDQVVALMFENETSLVIFVDDEMPQ